jgi:hypothetical protein
VISSIDLTLEISKIDCDVATSCSPQHAKRVCAEAKDLTKSQRHLRTGGHDTSTLARSDWEKCAKAVRVKIANGCPDHYLRFMNAADATPQCEATLAFLRKPQNSGR